VVYGKNKQRLRSLQNQGTPLAGGGQSIDKQCCIYGALILICSSWTMQVCWDVDKMYDGRVTVLLYRHNAARRPLQVRTRTEIRERYGIRANFVETRPRIAPYRCATNSWVSYRNAGR
jgi:hypothetical protein